MKGQFQVLSRADKAFGVCRGEEMPEHHHPRGFILKSASIAEGACASPASAVRQGSLRDVRVPDVDGFKASQRVVPLAESRVTFSPSQGKDLRIVKVTETGL